MNDNRKEIIEVKELYKFYQAGSTVVHALDGVSFEIYEGEFVAIIGPSGSGKSTLLNMLAGLEKPSKGEIIIADTHIENMSENQLVGFRRNNVGFIFQSYNLIPTMNALENVAMPLMFRGMGHNERNETAKKYLGLVGLEKQIYHKGNAMSGGQQQRVGIARALAMTPKIIFADEPTGNLDSKNADSLHQLFFDLREKYNQTFVIITHNPILAESTDRKLTMKDGLIIG